MLIIVIQIIKLDGKTFIFEDSSSFCVFQRRICILIITVRIMELNRKVFILSSLSLFCMFQERT